MADWCIVGGRERTCIVQIHNKNTISGAMLLGGTKTCTVREVLLVHCANQIVI